MILQKSRLQMTVRQMPHRQVRFSASVDVDVCPAELRGSGELFGEFGARRGPLSQLGVARLQGRRRENGGGEALRVRLRGVGQRGDVWRLPQRQAAYS